jgi:hypothetical protein
MILKWFFKTKSLEAQEHTRPAKPLALSSQGHWQRIRSKFFIIFKQNQIFFSGVFCIPNVIPSQSRCNCFVLRGVTIGS